KGRDNSQSASNAPCAPYSRRQSAPAAALVVDVEGAQPGWTARQRRGDRPAGARNNRAMPEETTTPDPLELTHRAYAALNSRDLDAFAGLLASSCVYDLSRFDLGTYPGPEAIRRFYEEWVEPLYEFGVVVDEIKNLGNGVIYAVQRGHRSRSPGFSLALEGGVVGVWEHGKLARMTVYPDRDEALADAEQLAQE